MGSGWHEWPLVLFTVLGQCVVGATLVSGLGWLSLTNQREAQQRLVRSAATAGAQHVFYLAADGHWFSGFGDASRFAAARV